MTSAGKVVLEVHGPVATLTLNRPNERNPIDWSTVVELRDAVARLEADPSVRAVLITGEGHTFSAGGDLKAYVDLYKQQADFRQFLDDWADLLDRIERSPQVYAALVEGACVAGGLELLLSCDIVIASDSARIGCGHVVFGQLPGAGGSQRLPRTVGVLRAKLLMLTGKLVPAAEAERIGLVSVVLPDHGFQDAAREFVARIMAHSPAGLRGVKHLVNRGMQMDVPSALAMERDYVHVYATTHGDATEGLQAFIEKRKPQFAKI